ncbi:hypothetical protein [Carnobacterium maltaromaticum]|uniref:hypothetical protein n=1 Tax=Carnobacterium maltaromaticum TaxID=2751 RepID=UPI0012FA401E|nr:hypothetical protein [Carnobacterium maltaromaticum]
MSNIVELEGEVKKVKSEITEIKNNEEKYFDAFVESMNNFMEIKINEIVPKIVRNEPKITNDLGREKLIEIKKYVSELILNNKSELTDELKKYNFKEMLGWYKKRYNNIFGEQDSRYDIVKEMCEVVGLSIGKIKSYLISSGYSEYAKVDGVEWTTTIIKSNYYPLLKIETYTLLENENIEEYVDEFWKLKKLEANLDKLEDTLSKLKAEELWDSI